MKRTLYFLPSVLLFVLAFLRPASAGITYTYNAAGRLIQVDYGNGTAITYAYDAAGNLLNRTVQAPTAVTIQTVPSGLQFTIDAGAVETAPQTVSLTAGSHTISVASPQAGTAGTQYVLSSWSDNGAASHMITVGASAATYTATFQTQYQLTTAASPSAGGSVSPPTGYFNAMAIVPLAATAATGFQFSGWTGPVANASSASTSITMTAPEMVTASFSSLTGITIQTTPPGLQFTIDSGTPQTLSLTPGNHTIALAATQPGSAGTQYVFTSWTDGSTANPRTIAVTAAPATYTATFTVQYLLTTAVSPASAGSVAASPSPAGYYNSGTSVQLTASANAGYQFSDWTGGLSGSTNPQSIVMNAAESVTANFGTIGSTCSFTLTPTSASLPPTGTSTVETCPNNSGQPNCGVTPETPQSFTVTPSAACGAWTATSSNPEFLQITSGAAGSGAGTVAFVLLNNTHNGQQDDSITVASGAASATYSVTEAGSGDSQVYREVYALYEQLLGRDPDPAGFAFWSGSGGAGLGQMADSFLASPEAFDSDFAVMAAYQAATDAPPTYAQFTAAVTSVQAGSETVSSLFTSLIGSGYSATTLYQNLLSRAPAAGDTTCINSGLGACFQTIIGYPSNTTPVGAANNEFQSTGTYRTTDHTNGLYVQIIYYVTVSRDPDAAGLAFWIGVANSGGPGVLFQGSAGYGTRIQILGPGTPNQGFIGSPEFQGLFVN
jgi:YD repeat-containing protein